MDAAEIEAFLALAQELHFTRTAERLRLSQSRVSRLISSLERKVGGSLFERTSRQVTLTPLGARLRNRAGPGEDWLAVRAERAPDSRRPVMGHGRLPCTHVMDGCVIGR